MTTKPIRETKTVKSILGAVESWHEFTFNYDGHAYTVLGALVGIDTAYRLCLWADLIEVDGKPMQTCGGYKCFYIEGLNTQIRIGKLHGRCLHDYTAIEQSCEAIYAYGPRWDNKKASNTTSPAFASSGNSSDKHEKARIARAQLEALFSSDKSK